MGDSAQQIDGIFSFGHMLADEMNGDALANRMIFGRVWKAAGIVN